MRKKMEKCVLLRGTYVMVIIQPWQVDMCFSDRKKNKQAHTVPFFLVNIFMNAA